MRLTWISGTASKPIIRRLFGTCMSSRWARMRTEDPLSRICNRNITLALARRVLSVHEAIKLGGQISAIEDRRDDHAGIKTTGHPADKWGWAVQAALQIKNIPTGAGDNINIQGVYTSAATRYNIQRLSNMGSVTMYNGTSNPFAYQKLTLGFAPDTIFANGFGQQAINTGGMRGAFNHNWDPYWSSALYGAWAQVQYSS